MHRFNKIFKLALIPVIMVSSSAMAHARTDKPMLNARLNHFAHCKVSKTMINNYEPEIFESTNNLLRKAGEAELYCGEKIIVHARVLDENCVPVPNAMIYGWQASGSGKYPYPPLKTQIDQNIIGSTSKTTFTGNGTASTNNKGEFHFITVYPPMMHGKSSHINIRVEHPVLGSLQTALFLKGKKVQNPKANLELNSISAIADKNGIAIYDFDIILSGQGIKKY